MKRFSLALLFSLLIGAASAQLSGGLMFPGPGMRASGGGGVQDPSQIFGANLVYWFEADSNTFTDTGCSVAATTTGQAVACWVDKTANAFAVKQSTSGKRPTLNTSGYN